MRRISIFWIEQKIFSRVIHFRSSLTESQVAIEYCFVLTLPILCYYVNCFRGETKSGYSFRVNSSSSSFGRDPHFQMLAVMVLSQHRVSTSKTVSPRIPVGARCTGHVRMICSAVCSTAPHSQFDVGARPHLCMNN